MLTTFYIHKHKHKHRLMKKLKQFEREWLHEVDQLIYDNLDNANFTIQTLAFQLHLSTASFYRKMTKLTDSSPADYIRQKRLYEAKDLLQTEPNYSFKKLANKVGYKREDYFAKIFEAAF